MSGEPAGAKVVELVAIMDRLRSPGGCPWDAQQTHESLLEYLVEEAYEVVEAIEAGDGEALREELGDLLLQIVFHARLAEESEQPWGIDEVAEGISAKLVRRHPHVFADADASGDLEAEWHARKLVEKGRESVTDDIPGRLPALLLAAKVLARSAAFAGSLTATRADATAEQALWAVEDEEGLGDVLLALVAASRERGWDAESALRGAVRRRIAQVRELEGL